MVALMFVASAYFLLPLFWIIIASTKSDSQLFSTNPLWFALPFNALNNIFNTSSYDGATLWRWFSNSIIYAGSVSAGTTLISAMAGFAFSKYDFFGKNILFYIILGAIMVPTTALVLPVYLLMHGLNLINTYWAVILPSLVNPFSIYLMRIFWMQEFPNELIDAAHVDGASDFTIFFRIGLPLVKGGLATVALFSFVSTWNNFFLPLVVISKSNLFPLTLGISIWTSLTSTGRGPSYGAITMGILISIVPLILAFILLRRYWQSGLSSGAVKG
jgi:multiple sugar transport system permease protein